MSCERASRNNLNSMLWGFPSSAHANNNSSTREVHAPYHPAPPYPRTANNIREYHVGIPFTAVKNSGYRDTYVREGKLPDPHHGMYGPYPFAVRDADVRALEHLVHDEKLDTQTRDVGNAFLNNLKNGTITDAQFLEMTHKLEAELFDFDNKIDDRLFTWMPWGFGDMCKKSYCHILPCFSIIIMIGLYATGLGSFVLTDQRITWCDKGLVIYDAGNITAKLCRGYADKCEVGGFMTFKTYIGIRMATYIMLLIPFLYIPFMTVLDISYTARKTWDELGLQMARKEKNNYEEKYEDKLEKTVRGTIDSRYAGSNTDYTKDSARYFFLHLSPSGHEKMLLFLFATFHFLLGFISTTFDAYAMNIDDADWTVCGKLNKALENDSFGIMFNIKKAAMYNFSIGIVFFALTLTYLLLQCRITLHKDAYKRKEKRERKIRERDEMNKHIHAKNMAEKEIEMHKTRASEMETVNAIESARKEGKRQAKSKFMSSLRSDTSLRSSSDRSNSDFYSDRGRGSSNSFFDESGSDYSDEEPIRRKRYSPSESFRSSSSTVRGSSISSLRGSA